MGCSGGMGAHLVDEWCVGSGTERHFVLYAIVADEPAQLLDPLDDVIVRILLARVQAFILLHLPAASKTHSHDD